MRYINLADHTRHNFASLKSVLDIVSKTNEYCDKHNLSNVELFSIEDNTWSDTVNKRYDIEIKYTDTDGNIIMQKLLYLKGEIIDGNEFHKRHNEFY